MKIEACTRARALIPFYLEGEVQPLEALETATHLSECSACAAESARGQRVLEGLRSLRPPAPSRDVAEGVLGVLRRVREGMTAGRALKWSALGIIVTGALLHMVTARPAPGFTVRMLTRLGEIINLDGLFDRIADLFSRIMPSATGFLDVISGGAPAVGGGAASIPPQLAAAVTLLAGALLIALLSGCAMLGGLLVGRLRSGAPNTSRPF